MFNHFSKDEQAKTEDVPLRILELNEEFNKSSKTYFNWPQIINENIARNSLSEFHKRTSLESLREFVYAICSRIYCIGDFKEICVKDIDHSLVKAPVQLTSSS